MAAAPETEVDITSLLQPRQGYLWKLGGGQEKGSKWNRRWFVLRDNVLMYFNSPKDFTGFRDKPSGVVLLEEGNVRTVDTGALQKYTFMLAHPNGESVVLAAETEKEMHEWMQAVRTSRMCITDADAAGQNETQRRTSAEHQIENALGKSSDADTALLSIEKELEAVQGEHREVEVEKEKAEKELKELMARFKLRKALLHWRHRKLTLSFRTLIRTVFAERISTSDGKKSSADARLGVMQDELDKVVAAREKAEAAKRRSEEMLTKELSLKKEGEAESREFEKLVTLEEGKAAAAKELVGTLNDVPLDSKEKEEILQLGAALHSLQSESEMLQQQLKRKVQSSSKPQ
jgi:hypothetical protein